MALPQTRPRSRVLTASASALEGPQSDTAKRRLESWQLQALSVIDLVPELNYASRFYSRMLKQLRIYPALMQPNGEAVKTDDELPVQMLGRIQDPGGGRSQILGRYGELMFATGEGLLFGRDLSTEDEQWSFVWTAEVDVETEGTGRDKRVKRSIHKPYGMSGDAEAQILQGNAAHPATRIMNLGRGLDAQSHLPASGVGR